MKENKRHFCNLNGETRKAAPVSPCEMHIHNIKSGRAKDIFPDAIFFM